MNKKYETLIGLLIEDIRDEEDLYNKYTKTQALKELLQSALTILTFEEEIKTDLVNTDKKGRE